MHECIILKGISFVASNEQFFNVHDLEGFKILKEHSSKEIVIELTSLIKSQLNDFKKAELDIAMLKLADPLAESMFFMLVLLTVA